MVAASQPADSSLMRWVPGEVCVLASLPAGAGGNTFDDPLADLPGRLADHIAARVADVAADGGLSFGGTLAASLRPDALRDYRPAIEPTGAVPLAPAGDDASLPADPRPGGGAGAWVVRFHDPGLANPARVRELVGLLNSDAHRSGGIAIGGGGAGGGFGATVHAVMPNWLLATAPKTHTGAGPGSQPMPAPDAGAAPGGQFPLADAFVGHFEGGPATPADVVVAILDTCPDPAAVQAAAATRFPGNALLGDVAGAVRIGQPPSIAPGAFAHLDPDGVDPAAVTVNWRDSFDAEDAAYAMPDHGLFVAGIVRAVAPEAEIHLIRALSDHGVGDMFGLIQLLGQLPEVLGIAGDRRLVVNLSLVADIPSIEALRAEWLPDTVGQPLTEAEAEQLRAIWLGAHAALRNVVTWLAAEKGALVVAAVGNDALDAAGGARPEPRVPAAYDEVLAVAALGLGSQAATYSNGGDVAGTPPNGVATYGGNARLGAAGQPPQIVDRHSNAAGPATPAADVDAVRGLFISDRFPLAAWDNTTGWAYWSGTSFAAPIVAALAARVWARHGDWQPPALIAALRNPPGTVAASSAELGTPVIVVR